MAKLLFIPVSIGGGLLAGLVGKKIFDQLWGMFDDEEPPDSKHRDISWGRLLVAGAIQGAIFRAVKEATTAPRAPGPARSDRIRSEAPLRRAYLGRKNRRIRALPDVRVQG